MGHLRNKPAFTFLAYWVLRNMLRWRLVSAGLNRLCTWIAGEKQRKTSLFFTCLISDFTALSFYTNPAKKHWQKKRRDLSPCST
jgi:hypothetical protein